jgi:hypothetical protein
VELVEELRQGKKPKVRDLGGRKGSRFACGRLRAELVFGLDVDRQL